MTAGRTASNASALRGPVRAPARRALLGLSLRLSALAGASLLGGCSPRLDWRESRLPGGEILVQLPARPASMTRPIHLRDEEIEMTMVGAEVEGLAFTVAMARRTPGATEADAGRHLGDMRDQMLRNIATTADAATERRRIELPVVDLSGASRGLREADFIDANGAAPHEGMRLQGVFFLARQSAAQAIVIGRHFDEAAARQFFGSLRIVES